MLFQVGTPEQPAGHQAICLRQHIILDYVIYLTRRGRSYSHVVSRQGMEVKLGEGRNGYEVRWAGPPEALVCDQNLGPRLLKMLSRQGGEGGSWTCVVSYRIVLCLFVS